MPAKNVTLAVAPIRDYTREKRDREWWRQWRIWIAVGHWNISNNCFSKGCWWAKLSSCLFRLLLLQADTHID